MSAAQPGNTAKTAGTIASARLGDRAGFRGDVKA
jgi:hypothetical protein